MLVNRVACLILILSSHKFAYERETLTNVYSVRSGVKITVHTFSLLILDCAYLVNPDNTILTAKAVLRCASC